MVALMTVKVCFFCFYYKAVLCECSNLLLLPPPSSGLIRCGSDSMIIADASTQTIYPQVCGYFALSF